MVASGVAERLNVLPGWPFCSSLCLTGTKTADTYGFLLQPSLDGGLPLLPLFNQADVQFADRVCSAAITVCCWAICA